MFPYTKYLKNYKKETIIAPIFKWLEAVFELIVPLITAYIIDTAIPQKNMSGAAVAVLIMAALGAFGLWFALICQKNASIAGQGFGTNLRNELYSHTLALSLEDIDKLGGAYLKTAMTSDIYQMEIAVARFLRLVVRSPFLVVGAVFMTFFISVKLALIMLVFSLICGVVLYVLTARTVKYLKQNQLRLQEFSTITQENLSGAKAVKAFGKQSYEQLRFLKVADSLEKTSLKFGGINSTLNPLSQVIINFGIIAIIYFGAFEIQSGALTAGKLIAVINYMFQILSAIGLIIFIMGMFSRSHASGLRVKAVLDIKLNEMPAFVAKDNYLSGEFLQFKDVSFSYLKDGKYSLKDITFGAERGGSLGIIGGTGSGKSTIVNLLKAQYFADKGQIILGGVEIANYEQKDIAVSFQNIRLFSGTVRDNLQLGNQSLQDKELDRALTIAQGYDFVYSKAGLDTIVAENGSNFSGGQRQRLSIARALALKPKVLILDDSFSALDTRTAKRIRTALDKINFDLKIIISQRIADIKQCDNILFLTNGELEMSGSHVELIKNCPKYREICLVQEEAIL